MITKFLRTVPSSCRRSASNGLYSSLFIIPAQNSFRTFSYSSQEPGFQVDWDDSLPDPDDFTPAYLTDHKKMEIYLKHKNDPKEWNVKTISQRYGLSLLRAKAVLWMMKEREKMMEELGVLNIPLKWQEIYDEHIAEPEAKTKEVLAEKHSLSVEEVETILKNMGEHNWRKQNLNDSNEYHDQVLDFLAMAGTNTTFRETGEEQKDGQLGDDSYYDPVLFGDEDFDAMKEKIRERLIRETKASQKKDFKVQKYESRVATWNKLFKTVPGLRNDPVEGLPPAESGTELTRWKYAFRELRQQKKGEASHPTVITMRDGRTRLANPLEELSRSWSKRPRGLTAIDGQQRLQKFHDPDGDDEMAKAISHADRIRRETLLRENGLLKRKK